MTTDVVQQTAATTYRLKSPQRQGTAFAIAHEGEPFVVTALHVVASEDTGQWFVDEEPHERNILFVKNERHRLIPAAADFEADVALLRFEDSPPPKLTPHRILASANVMECQWKTRAYPEIDEGKPRTYGGSILAIEEERSPNEGLQLHPDEPFTDWPGVSGGPVLVGGQVSGVITQKDPGKHFAWGAPSEVLLWLASIARSNLVCDLVAFLERVHACPATLYSELEGVLGDEVCKIANGPPDKLHAVIARKLLSRAGQTRDFLGELLAAFASNDTTELAERWKKQRERRAWSLREMFKVARQLEVRSPSSSLPATPQGRAQQTDGVVPVDVGGTWLTSGKANICIVQTSCPDEATIEADASRATVVRTLTDLLVSSNNRALLHRLNGDEPEPAIVVLPEYALGSPDWDDVDRLVREEFSGDLILIAGFGATTGSWLNEWAGGNEETERLTAWPTDTPLNSPSIYNGGWAWVRRETKNGIEVRCVTYLKNFFEQKHELVNFPRLRPGKRILRLETDDVVIFPLICADLLCSEGDRPLKRIDKSLDARRVAGKNVLIIGSLAQRSYHPAWENTVIAGVESPDQRRALVLANHAVDGVDRDTKRDRWRTLSGVYNHPRLSAKTSCFPEVRAINETSFHGRLSRTTEPTVLSGGIRWSFGATSGAYLWTPEFRCPIDNDGSVGAQEATDSQGYEFYRLLRADRESADTDGEYPTFGWLPAKVRAFLNSLECDLRSDKDPVAADLVPSILYGLRLEGVPQVGADSISEYREYLSRGVVGMAVVNACNECRWVSDGPGPLQTDEGLWVLVWVDPKLSSRELRKAVQTFVDSSGYRRTMCVVRPGGIGSSGDPGLISSSSSRDDISDLEETAGIVSNNRNHAMARHIEAHKPGQTSPHMSKDITQPAPTRSAIWMPLGYVENLIVDSDSDEETFDKQLDGFRAEIRDYLSRLGLDDEHTRP